EHPNLDLSSWRLALNSSEPVRRETLRQFKAVFESCGFRAESFFPYYGLTEATAMVSAGSISRFPKIRTFDSEALQSDKVLPVRSQNKNSKALVSAGRCLINQRIKIVNPYYLSESLVGEVGEIWISGPNIGKGYWNRPKETEQVFNGYLSSTGEGPFLRSG